MQESLPAADQGRLEGLCEDALAFEPRIRLGQGSAWAGIERLEARFSGPAFAPHRHDTYAIGLTLAGVQVFRYRGALRYSLPGQCHVLHPDELHDGAAGSAAGFAYRIAYVDPALVQEAQGGGGLPFATDPVLDLSASWRSRLLLAWDLDVIIDEVGRVDLLVALADLLAGVAEAAPASAAALPLRVLGEVREAIRAAPGSALPSAALERLSGLDRWTLARAFRAAYGTSPSRYRTLRQLDGARELIASGQPLAEVAMAVGFSDQSHMTRQFKRAYGLTPGRWAAALS